MAKFTFNGEETLIYSDIDGASLEAVPGETYDISAAPDTLWTPAGSAPAPSTPAEPTEAPVSDANPTA